MPDFNRIGCTNCGKSIFNVQVKGPDGATHRVPLVVRITCGQPEDTGGPLDVNDSQIRMPSFVRELMHTPLPRMELCVVCAGAVLGLPLVTWDEDPLAIPVQKYDQMLTDLGVRDETVDKSERFSRMHRRALAAFKIAWGEEAVADLPAPFRPAKEDEKSPAPPSPAVPAAIARASAQPANPANRKRTATSRRSP